MMSSRLKRNLAFFNFSLMEIQGIDTNIEENIYIFFQRERENDGALVFLPEDDEPLVVHNPFYFCSLSLESQTAASSSDTRVTKGILVDSMRRRGDKLQRPIITHFCLENPWRLSRLIFLRRRYSLCQMNFQEFIIFFKDPILWSLPKGLDRALTSLDASMETIHLVHDKSKQMKRGR